MIKEKFKDVVGYPDYMVSNFGRVVSKERKVRFKHAVTGEEHFRTLNEILLKQYNSKFGYKFVQLRIGGVPKNFTIHRLVAIAFIDNPDNYKVVNHKNGNKIDNSIENLEWCTDVYNHEHATKNNLKPSGERVGSSKLNDACVKAIRGLAAKEWSDTDIAELFGVHRSTINLVKNHKTWRKAALTGTELEITL